MDFKGLDLNLLVVLDALFAERNITRTGQRVHLSQSATSGALARLREFFRDELLVHVGHQMVLTPLAEALVQPVREALLQTERIVGTVPAFDPATSHRHFVLMISDHSANVLMEKALPRIQHLAPGVTFELFSNAVQPAECLERGEVDLLIMPPLHISKTHPFEELFQDPYVCLVWTGNPKIGTSISLEEYESAGHVGVRLNKQGADTLDEWLFDRIGFRRRIEVAVTTHDLIPRLIVGTTRVATAPERLARDYAGRFPIRILPLPVELPPLVEDAQWHKCRDTDSAIVWLRRQLREIVELERSLCVSIAALLSCAPEALAALLAAVSASGPAFPSV